MVVETYKLINAIKKMYPVLEFLHNRYFPDGKVYYSEKALIETKKKGRKVAPFVVPVVGGIVMESEGYRAYEIDAPYIAPKMPITADELSKKAFGESPESGRTPAQRENEIQSEHMDDLRHSVCRRIELMCAEIITTGKVIMKHFSTAEDAAKDANYTVKQLQFFEDEFSNKYAFSKNFADMTASEKILEFYKMASVLKKRGIKATDMVMTSDVAMLLMSDIDFLDFYDKARVEIGSVKPSELPDGIVCNGSININGVVMTMFTYDEEYEDLDGTVKEIFPKGTLAFLHPGLGKTVYAQVTFVQGKGFVSHAEKIIPRLVVDEGNNIATVQVFSRPVPYPDDWEGWLVSNIYDEVSSVSFSNDFTENSNIPAYDGGGFTGEPDQGEIVFKTADEINAMTRKTDVIDYAEYIGLTGLDALAKLGDLKNAVLNYQEELQDAGGN